MKIDLPKGMTLDVDVVDERRVQGRVEKSCDVVKRKDERTSQPTREPV